MSKQKDNSHKLFFLCSKYVAANGRLNGHLAWCAAVLDGKQYIMVDLGTVSTVKQIITQGWFNIEAVA